MKKTKNRGRELPVAVLALIRVAVVLMLTVAAAIVCVLILSAVIYQTDDPAAHIGIAAYIALFFTAALCGVFSALLCRKAPFACAMCASGAAVCVMLATAALSGGVRPVSVTVYAGFMLASVLFARLIPQRGTKRHKKRR